ncbi:phage tail assembly chaperone [Alcaligenes sp. NLF5-7]
MARPVEVTVNDTIFLITPMDAFEALEVFGDLQKDLLPAVGSCCL